MAQMFIDPRVIRAFRTVDGLESFDLDEEVEWYVFNEDTRQRIHGPYPTYEDAMPVFRAVREQQR